MTSNDISTVFKECLETLNAISQQLENASYPVIARNSSIFLPVYLPEIAL